MLKILLLSAPPGAGKDTAAQLALNLYPTCDHEKFSYPLRQAACALLGITDGKLEEQKRTDPRIRQLLIKLSEDVIKPVYGKRHFGELCAHRVIKSYLEGWDKIVISDCGFSEELAAFEEIVGERFIGEVELQLWQIHRPDCSFAGDSRNYVTLPGRTRQVFNSGELANFEEEVKQGLEAFFGKP
jgi:hypothetical protein